MGKVLKPTQGVIIVSLHCGFAATLHERYRCLKSADPGGNERSLLRLVPLQLWVRAILRPGLGGQDGGGGEKQP